MREIRPTTVFTRPTTRLCKNSFSKRLDAPFADSALEPADRADESQDLTYVDIDTFLENF